MKIIFDQDVMPNSTKTQIFKMINESTKIEEAMMNIGCTYEYENHDFVEKYENI